MHFLSKFMTKILKFFFKRSKTKHLLTSSISMQCHISKIGYHVWTVKIIEPVGGLKVMKTLLKETTMQLDFISKLICCLGRSPIHIYTVRTMIENIRRHPVYAIGLLAGKRSDRVPLLLKTDWQSQILWVWLIGVHLEVSF